MPKRASRRLARQIFNATIGGKLEVFPRVDYHDVVNRPATRRAERADQYLLSRALERAALLGAEDRGRRRRLHRTDVEAILSASPLEFAAATDADVFVIGRVPTLAEAASERRVLVLVGDPTADDGEFATMAEWLASVLVDCLARAACCVLDKVGTGAQPRWREHGDPGARAHCSTRR